MKRLLPFFLFSQLIYAQTVHNTIRTSYQNLKFNNENLGLLETGYFFNFKRFYTGISIYSAVSGKRGGFFTGGINAGYRFPFKKFILDSGVFLGGGGGGSAPQGSGLMLKIYGGVLYKYKNYDFGININKIKFKDGSINSTQLGIVADYNFEDYYFTKPVNYIKHAAVSQMVFTPVIKIYYPLSCKTTAGNRQNKFSLLGAEIKKLYEGYFVYTEAAGAFQGESDGYAEFLFGAGKHTRYFDIKGFMGSAGGGKVDTKSGLVGGIELSGGFSSLTASAGYIRSDGSFKAYYIKAGINKKFNFIVPGNKTYRIKSQKFSFKIYSESYLPSNTLRKNGNSDRLDVLNISLGKYLTSSTQVFINAAAAYNGNSGGYAVGGFGIQYSLNRYFFTNVTLAAAGGGNVAVGGGIITKASLGFKYRGMFISLGRIKALNGKLNTYTAGIGYTFNFYKGSL